MSIFVGLQHVNDNSSTDEVRGITLQIDNEYPGYSHKEGQMVLPVSAKVEPYKSGSSNPLKTEFKARTKVVVYFY